MIALLPDQSIQILVLVPDLSRGDPIPGIFEYVGTTGGEYSIESGLYHVRAIDRP